VARILAVDDEIEVADLLSRILTELGHQVRVAHSGSEALQEIEAAPPDLVILDIVMPEMGGVEVCRRIRADSALASLPILFLTAMIEPEDKLAGFAVGADDYITKPFDTRELAARVQAILRRARPTATVGFLRAGELTLNLSTFEVSTPTGTFLLTPVEFGLLRYLMEHANQVIHPERLLREVWRYPPGTGDPALVRRHIKNLREKLEPTPAQPRYILTVSRHGYIVRSD
jgi:DNA-binding response OmpR family regulator